MILVTVLSFIIILIAKEQNNFYVLSSLTLIIFFQIFLVLKLIDKDHNQSINQPLTMKFLNRDYLIFRIQAIKETLQKEGRYNENFLNITLEECERYLILEANGVSFILKHPLMIIPLTIVSSYLGSLLWEAHNYSQLTIVFVGFTIYMIFIVSPVLENRFAKVRTMKFILRTLKNQIYH
jgi:hypothetical protein